MYSLWALSSTLSLSCPETISHKTFDILHRASTFATHVHTLTISHIPSHLIAFHVEWTVMMTL